MCDESQCLLMPLVLGIGGIGEFNTCLGIVNTGTGLSSLSVFKDCLCILSFCFSSFC